MKHILEAAKKAAGDTAHFIQRDIRRSALEHGWDPEVVKNTHVKWEDNKFAVHVAPEHADKAFVHEYGNETNQPTAVIRKYNNHSSAAGNAFLKSMYRHLGGKL